MKASIPREQQAFLSDSLAKTHQAAKAHDRTLTANVEKIREMRNAHTYLPPSSYIVSVFWFS